MAHQPPSPSLPVDQLLRSHSALDDLDPTIQAWSKALHVLHNLENEHPLSRSSNLDCLYQSCRYILSRLSWSAPLDGFELGLESRLLTTFFDEDEWLTDNHLHLMLELTQERVELAGLTSILLKSDEFALHLD